MKLVKSKRMPETGLVPERAVRTRPVFLLLLVILLAPQAAWCAGDDDNAAYLEQTGRYFDLIRVVEKRFAEEDTQMASDLGPLCMAYSKVKNYAKLFDCANKLEARVQAGDTHIKYPWFSVSDADASPIPNMLRAEAYLELGNYEKSIEEGERALSHVPEKKGYDNSLWPPVKYRLTILADMAVASALAGKQKQADKLIEKLSDASIPFFGRSNWIPVQSNGLARAYMATRQYERVLDELNGGLLDQSLFNLSDALSHVGGYVNGDDSIKTIFELPKLFMLAKAQLELGRAKEAKQTFDTLLANRRLPEIGDIYWPALYERGRIAASEVDPDGAIGYWKRAIEIIEAQRSTLNTEANKIGFAGDKQAVYAHLVALLIEQGKTAEAFEYVERSKSRALVDMLASKKDFSVHVADANKVRELIARADQSEVDARAIAYAAPPSVQETSPENLHDEAATRGSRTLAVIPAMQEIRQDAPGLASLLSVSVTPLADIQRIIPEDEALLEYYYDNKALYAFVLTRQGLQAWLLDVNGLEADVRELRNTVEQPGSEAYLDPSRRLYARLIRPLESGDSIAGKTKLIVVAHGILHYLPFAALHDGNRFLVDKYSLRFLPSASVLSYLRSSGVAKPGGILAFGNPDLGDAKYDLPFAQDEALAVVKTVQQSRALIRSEATVSALRQYATGFRYLHFATHGNFQADAPLKSGLYLARDADNDGVLTVSELYSMNLDADMVTLSACETGLGKTVNGDDVIGLTRGFIYAGSRSIVASLWSVDDKATSELMESFYANLSRTNKEDALRQAQIKARASFPHPYYWAAFQLTGRAD